MKVVIVKKENNRYVVITDEKGIPDDEVFYSFAELANMLAHFFGEIDIDEDLTLTLGKED